MKEVRHRKRKAISKKLCFLLFLLIIGILVAAYFLWFAPKPAPLPSVPEISEEPDLLLFTCGSDEIFSVAITPRKGEPYTLAWHDGVFVLDEDPDYPIRQALLSDLAVYATYVTAMDALIDLSVSSTDPDGHILTRADFGLEPAAYTVRITSITGDSITLYFGDYFEDGAFIRHYLATDRDDIIYIASSDLYDAFSYDRHMLHTVDRPDLHSSLLDSITIYGEIELTLSRDRDYWFITAPVRYPASEDAVANLLKYIDNMRFSSWVGNANDLDLADYGLEHPRTAITFTSAESIVEGYDENNTFVSVNVPQKTKRLLIGRNASETENVSFYCLYDDTVYIGTYFTLGFLTDLKPSDLYLPNPVSYAANAIEQVTFSTADTARVYDIRLIESVLPNGELETDSLTGEQIYSLSVSADGALIDTDRFLVWYNQLTQLSASGLIDENGYAPEGAPLYTITLRFMGNTRKIDLYRYDPLHLAVSIDDTCLFYLPASSVEALTACP